MATVVAGKYELLEVLRDAGVRTCRARQVTLGHILMVHFIPGSQRGDDFALLERLAQLPESARKLFFDAGEHDSVPYVVSWPLPEFDSLPDWLDRTIAKNRQQSRDAAAPKTQPADSSEFTRLFFRDMKEPAASGAGDLVTGHSPTPPHVKESPLPPKEPGEFTRFFQIPAKIDGPTKPKQEPLAPPPAQQAPAAPPLSGPGEFTQFFQQGAPAEPPPSPSPLPKPPAVAENPIQTPAAPIPAVSRPPAASVSPEPIVADDYAKVIARPPALPMPPAPPVAPRKPAAALPPLPQLQRPRSSAYLPMWITLAVLFVLAVALTLFLALAR